MELIKKITTKTVIGDVAKALGDKQSVPLYTAVGIAMGTKSGSSQYGDWLAFRGRFEAVNLFTGEISQSAILFLPEVATDLLLAELSGGANMIQFAFEIGVRKPHEGEASGTGYVYTVKPHSKPSEADPLADLRKLLPAPDKKAEK